MTGRGFLRALVLVLALSLLGAGAAVSALGTRQPRIVNGVQTQQSPSTGALLMDFDGLLGGICSGTLVGCQHFVTAAHCVCIGGDAASCGTPDPARFRVYLQHAGVLAVSAIAVNPTFSFGTAGDVAVLTLSSPSTGIRPTSLNVTENPNVGTAGTIAGFGVTGGAASDFGLLRQGAVTVSSCGAVAAEPAHVCWTFDDLSGAPGTDSNACSGDSGGPLFVGFGGHSVLAGVASGGVSTDCLPFDVSFASNVLQNQSYIESIGGVDLSSTSCGSTAQIGDGGTHVTALSFDGPSRIELTCRKFVAKAYSVYTSAKLRLMQKCLDGVRKGSLTGPCPDGVASAKIEKAANRAAARMARNCTPAVVAAIGAVNACAGARDAFDLQSCILAAADAATDNLLVSEYADGGPIADVSLRTCRAAITKTTSTYGINRLRLLAKCQASADSGKVESCPDAAAQAKIASKAAKVQSALAAKCTDEQVAALNSSGTLGSCGTIDSAAALARCAIATHDAETDVLFALLDSVPARRQTSLDIPPGTAQLRVALNGIDASANDLDLYVKRGAPPTTTVFDARSINGGVYESIDLASPGAATWYVLVNPVRGTNVPYQLTITAFGP